MTNQNIRLFPHDPVMRAIFLPWLPKWITPNRLTVTRFILTPAVLFFLWQGRWLLTFFLFLFAAFTDALDGSVARLRKQITMWGTVADPIADKILIGSVAVVFVAKVIGLWLAVILLACEVLVIAGVLYRRWKGKISSANVYGKTKMLLQVVGVTFLLIGQISSGPGWTTPAIACFLISFLFAFLSFITYSF